MQKYRYQIGAAVLCALIIAVVAWKKPWRNGGEQLAELDAAVSPDLAMASILNAVIHPVMTYEDNERMEIDAALSANGDMDGDGIGETAVILSEEAGRGVVFMSVVVFRNDGGKAEYAGGMFLGDRVSVRSLSIKDGVLTVDYLSHKMDDYLADPTKPAELKLKLEGGALRML